ncbi:hypothetical protein ACIF8T_08385 [Streptomyces sp. NPDC085946]|uniref:hypothetical protein n=1 Tax=Streptomyces sp. NPDC085946 TaxID=3365744 RepID=UPI0037D0A2CA
MRAEADRRAGQRRGVPAAGSAESAQVLEISGDFRPGRIPAAVVRARDGGPAERGRARTAGDVAEPGRLRDHGVRGAEIRGPVVDRPAGPRAARVFAPVTRDERGRERIAPAVDAVRGDVGGGADGPAVHVTGPGGTSADFAEGSEGIRLHAAVLRDGRRGGDAAAPPPQYDPAAGPAGGGGSARRSPPGP